MEGYNNNERKTPNVRQQMQRPSKTVILIFCLIGFVFYFLSQEGVVLEEWKPNGGINNGMIKQQLQQAQQPQQLLTDVNDDNEELVMNVTQVQGGFSDTPQHLFDANNLCSAFSGTSRASRLWKDHLEAILQALQVLPDDDLAKLRGLLQTVLSPARMRRAVQHLPTFRHEQLRRVVEILQKRFQADDDDDSHPPLRIAVFGGSVTIGRGCSGKRRMQHFACAWPNRFEHLVNQFFGRKIIKVYNLGIGGTSTSTATNRVKYWMNGDPQLSKLGPDVIVNSYSTNDSLPPWGKQWPKDDLIGLTRDKVHTSLEQFIREALKSKPPCETPPLIVHVDDYLGPQQPALLGELTYVSEMTQLAKYYDTVGISYGEVVRDITYQDRTETDFHNHLDVHFGRIAHTTIALSVAFASLELLINFCDDEMYIGHDGDTNNTTTTTDHSTIITKEQMKEDKLFLPPPLTKELLLANSTNEFEAALEDSYRSYIEDDCLTTTNHDSGSDDLDRNPCTIAWISTPGNWNAKAIRRFMTTYQTVNNGWDVESQMAEGWSNKDGWIAKEPKATFTLVFPATTKTIKTVSLYFLRSYGDKWKDSNARFTISKSKMNVTLAQHEIAGVHADEDYRYSLTMSETIVLSEPVAIGEGLTMTVDLVSGGHFKIMGLMLCNK